MTEPEPSPRPDWSPVPRPGCVNVEGKVLLAREGLVLAMLKLDAQATIDEHSAPYEIDVVCLEGEGFISIEDRVWAFRRGLTLTWPAGHVHRLWTADAAMVTLMVERPGGALRGPRSPAQLILGMSRAATAAQMAVRVTFLIQIVLGLAFWTGHLLGLVTLHIVSGIVLVLGLWVLAALGARSGAPLGLVVLAAVWGAVVIVFGLNHDSILTGGWHWLTQILHLLLGIGAIGQAEALGRRIRQGAPAPKTAT